MFVELILNKLRKSKIIIYGIGQNGLYTFRYLKACGINVDSFVDQKAEDGLNEFQGKPCLNINKISLNNKICIIVTPYVDNLKILNDIQKLGFNNCICWKEMEILFQMNPMKIWNPECHILLSKNEKYKNAYQGERCFIVGTGPSLKNQDLSKLKNEFVFTVNTGYKLQDFVNINSNFHVFVDSMYFSPQIDTDEQINFANDLKEKLSGDLICFFPYSKANKFILQYSLDKTLCINYIEEDLREYWGAENIDFTKLTPLTGTVVLTAVLLAIYMGFSEINLLGCDCTDILTSIGSKIKNNSMVTYAWSNDDRQQKRLEKTLGTRSFENIYHIQYLKFKNFRHINNICSAMGIKFFNCTEGGFLDCVERRNFNDIRL